MKMGVGKNGVRKHQWTLITLNFPERPRFPGDSARATMRDE